MEFGRVLPLALFGIVLAIMPAKRAMADNDTVDACHLVQPDLILTLLTLSPSTIKFFVDGNRCSFSVVDGSGVNGAWVDNRGSADLTRSDFASNAAALNFQHDETPLYDASHLVLTADPNDRVVVSPDHPEIVWAVHDSAYVSLSVTNVTAEARAHPSWAYRVQRTALEAAGATTIPRTAMAPDPFVPGQQPDKPAEPLVWMPPPHIAAGSGVTDMVLHILTLIARYRFFVLPVCVFIPIAIAIFRRPKVPVTSASGGRLTAWLFVAGIVFVIGGLLASPQISTILIYRSGAAGGAVVTGSYATSTQYNSQAVRGHHVLIRMADGRVASADFRSDDFNVYPVHNATSYPRRGDAFTVRYLTHFPGDFVIVSDDDSPWAMGMRCHDLTSAVIAAAEKVNFAPDIPDYKKAYEDAVAAKHGAGCPNGLPVE